MGDDDAVDVAGQRVAPDAGAVLLLSDVAEVGEAPLVLERRSIERPKLEH